MTIAPEVCQSTPSRPASRFPIEKSARDAGERARHDECGELEAGGIVPDALGAILVLAHRGEHGAEGRRHDANRERRTDRCERERKIIINEVVVEPQTEERSPRRHVEAVFAAGEIDELKREEVLNLADGERNHREKDAAAPYREGAYGQGQHGGVCDAREDRDGERRNAVRDRNRRHVTRPAPKQRVSERKQSRETEQHIEGDGDEGEAHEVDCENDVDPGDER